MNRPTVRTSLFAAAMLAASTAFAGGDIVKCVDQNGHITLTETQCSEGVQTVLVAGADTPAPTASEPAPTRRIQRVAYAPEVVQHDTWASSLPRAKMLARDAETLKAARISMKVLDETASTLRHQRLAGVN